MLELPESTTISQQAGQKLIGRKITEVVKATSPHKFAFYNGDPANYLKLLIGRKVKSTNGHGMFVDIYCDADTGFSISEGANMRYFAPSEERPLKHQLLIGFDNGSCVAFTVAMYGLIWAYKGVFENKYYLASSKSISPLDDTFDEKYFNQIIHNVEKDISAKALLATEQRIPGIGNGVLQDILFNAGIHPKCKKSKLSDFNKSELFHSIKVTLQSMTDKGGRDTEKDFFGQNGGYKTLLSKNTVNKPCPNCGDIIVKEAYLGGAVYYCKTCQKL